MRMLPSSEMIGKNKKRDPDRFICEVITRGEKRHSCLGSSASLSPAHPEDWEPWRNFANHDHSPHTAPLIVNQTVAWRDSQVSQPHSPREEPPGTFLLCLPELFSLLQQGDHFWFGKWESCSQTKRKRKCLGFVLTQRAIPEWKMHGGYKKLQWVAQVVPPHERCVRKKKGLIGHTYVILSCMLGKYKHTALTGLSIEDGTYQMYRLN